MLPLMLSLCWLGLGMLIGALANAAKLRPAAWARRGWMVVLGIGALVALLGGWLGAALLGLTFAWPTAVWCAVLGVALLPRLIAWWGARRRAYRRPRPI
ncbi:MAG TPA: hypothetical protein VKV37_24655 [Ktedonobacteraceae bacterium]|jgi:hypothetical protein|nr:hypothetical protein [Ktedonobacteraceae bacterium]